MAKTKFKFGTAPKSFKKAVEIVMIDGKTAEIEFDFIYRTRKQYAALVDENMAAVKAEQAARDGDEAVDRTVAEWFDIADKNAVGIVLKSCTGWDLENEFGAEALLKLEDEHPGSLGAINAAYRTSVADARAKN